MPNVNNSDDNTLKTYCKYFNVYHTKKGIESRPEQKKIVILQKTFCYTFPTIKISCHNIPT